MARRALRNKVDSSSTGVPDTVEVSSNGPASNNVRHNSDVGWG